MAGEELPGASPTSNGANATSSEMEPEPTRDSGTTSGITELRRAQKTPKEQLERGEKERTALQTPGSVKEQGQELPHVPDSPAAQGDPSGADIFSALSFPKNLVESYSHHMVPRPSA